MTHKKRFGIVGGLGPLAGADIFFKLVKATPAVSDKEHFNVIYEQHPFDEGNAAAEEHFNPNARKLYVFNIIKTLEQRNIDAVILTCFISHSFIDELKPEIRLPIINIMEALQHHIRRHYPTVRRLGVLTSDYLKKKRLFERYFPEAGYELIYPRPEIQKGCLMEAIYGRRGIKAGQLRGQSIDLIEKTCRDLVAEGAELIVPGFTEIPIVIDSLPGDLGVPIIDSNQIYAEYAIDYQGGEAAKPYKIGIVGGVGPAATVDFMNKIIRHTRASRDQDHVKMMVEHNPQIPDRTENLIGEGADPTIPLYAACKKLEKEADLIAIPCNTAHAYVERIQRYLSIPVVNMLYETVEYIKRHYSDRHTLGLLATTGTVKSRVYHDMVAQTVFELIAPDETYQQKVMDAIYGEQGVKAGFIEGRCKEDLMAALAHLVDKGAEVVILGCTELPLLLPQTEAVLIAGIPIAVLDPTEILARKCVGLVRSHAI